jgi:hypothetical protein
MSFEEKNEEQLNADMNNRICQETYSEVYEDVYGGRSRMGDFLGFKRGPVP